MAVEAFLYTNGTMYDLLTLLRQEQLEAS